MKKLIGAAVANWLRKPENREKAKRTAKELYGKYQNRNKPNDSNPKPGPGPGPKPGPNGTGAERHQD